MQVPRSQIPLRSTRARRYDLAGSREAGMKIGFCMLLWTTHVTEQHRAILEDLKATGYDGVEIPIFEGTPDHYAKLGRMLDEIGLERTAITIIPSLDKNPVGDAEQRKAGLAWLKHVHRLHRGARREAACRAAAPDARTLHRQGPDRHRAEARGRRAPQGGRLRREARHPARRSRRSTASSATSPTPWTSSRLSRHGRSSGGDRHVRHLPRQPRGDGPDRRLHAQRPAHVLRPHLRERPRRARGAGTCRGRRRSARSRNPASTAG